MNDKLQESLIASEIICKSLNDREISIISTQNDPIHLRGQQKREEKIKDLLSHCAQILQYPLFEIREIPQGKRLSHPIELAIGSGKTGPKLILETAVYMANFVRSQINKVEKLDYIGLDSDLCPNCSLIIQKNKDKCPQCGIWLNIINNTHDHVEGFELDL